MPDPRNPLDLAALATELHAAIVDGDAGSVKLLLAKGARAELAADGQEPPSILAVLHDRPEILSALVCSGADPHARNRLGTPLFTLAAMKGHVRCARLLIAAGVDLEARETTGQTALHAAASKGKAESVSLLIQEGADIHALDFQAGDAMPWTPAMWAAFKGHAECLGLLVGAGADLAYRDAAGYDASELAIIQGHLQCSDFIAAHLERLALEAGCPLPSKKNSPTRI